MSDKEQILADVERIFEREQKREERRAERRQSWLSSAPEILTSGIDMDVAALDVTVFDTSSRVLVAEGDSWFDYPGTDVLEELEDVYLYEVSSVAHHGDTLESMAYGERQLDGLNHKIKKLSQRGKVPKAILLSAGGNDLAGNELGTLLNHARSGLDVLNEDVVRGLIDIRLHQAYIGLIEKIGVICKKYFDNADIPVLIHGYDRPVPDGRGFWGGWGPLPGPWLQPGFLLKGHENLEANTSTMGQLIDRFNEMLVTLTEELDHVHYVDLRGVLGNELSGNHYKEFWDNELHPEDTGFAEVAWQFQQALAALL